MPTLTKSWNRSIAPTPQAKIVPNGSLERQPLVRIRHRRATKEAEQHDRADVAELLGEDREDEVGVLDRQQAEGVLGAVGQALAEEATRADGDLGLVELVAGALDVRERIEERGQPCLLVVGRT
jgi:hypothetical protein